MSRLHNIELQVKRTMITDKFTRGNDRLLLKTVLEKYYGIRTFEEYVFAKGAPAAESITRARRKIQESGRLLPEGEVAQERMERELDHREYFGRNHGS
jgi:hypothetical protein